MSPSEIEVQLTALREKIDERDRLYTERDNARRTAVEAALASVKEQTAASFAASEKAIVKAEDAQRAYNQSHNDLARKMDDQNKGTIPRAESEARFKALEEKIALLSGSFHAGTGAAQGVKASKEDTRANIALIIALLGAAIGLIVFFTRTAP